MATEIEVSEATGYRTNGSWKIWKKRLTAKEFLRLRYENSQMTTLLLGRSIWAYLMLDPVWLNWYSEPEKCKEDNKVGRIAGVDIVLVDR